jgi:hypothetical protein
LSRLPVCCKTPILEDQVFLQGFLSLDRLPTMTNESRLPAT